MCCIQRTIRQAESDLTIRESILYAHLSVRERKLTSSGILNVLKCKHSKKDFNQEIIFQRRLLEEKAPHWWAWTYQNFTVDVGQKVLVGISGNNRRAQVGEKKVFQAYSQTWWWDYSFLGMFLPDWTPRRSNRSFRDMLHPVVCIFVEKGSHYSQIMITKKSLIFLAVAPCSLYAKPNFTWSSEWPLQEALLLWWDVFVPLLPPCLIDVR